MGHRCGKNCRRKTGKPRCYSCNPRSTWGDSGGTGGQRAARGVEQRGALDAAMERDIRSHSERGKSKREIASMLGVSWSLVYAAVNHPSHAGDAPTHCPRCKSRLGYDHDGEPLSCITCGYEHYI